MKYVFNVEPTPRDITRFRMRFGRREITTSVNPDIAASLYEDLRLLRWKSAGVHDPGDILLNDVGDRLAALFAPPATWKQLRLPDDARHVRVQFSQTAHRLMQFPWELLRVHNQCLIGAHGSHLVREIPAPAARARRRNSVTNIVHISLGTDSTLRFDEERCTLGCQLLVLSTCESARLEPEAATWRNRQMAEDNESFFEHKGITIPTRGTASR